MPNEPKNRRVANSALPPAKSFKLPDNIMPYAKKMAAQNNGRFIITDKGSKMTYYGTLDKNGNATFDKYEVLTGKNDSPKAGMNKGVVDIPFGQIDKENAAGNYTNHVTPLGTFKPKLMRAYDSPALNYTPNSKGSTAVHKTYPGELKKREALYGDGNTKNNNASYGCINGRCGDVNKMVEFFKEGDIAYIVDTRLSTADNMKVLDNNIFYEHPTANSNKIIPGVQKPNVITNPNNKSNPALAKTSASTPTPKALKKEDKTIVNNNYKPTELPEDFLRTDSPDNNTFPTFRPDLSMTMQSLGIAGLTPDFNKSPQVAQVGMLNKKSEPLPTTAPAPTWAMGQLKKDTAQAPIETCTDGTCKTTSFPSIEDKQKDLSITMQGLGLSPNLFNAYSNSTNVVNGPDNKGILGSLPKYTAAPTTDEVPPTSPIREVDTPNIKYNVNDYQTELTPQLGTEGNKLITPSATPTPSIKYNVNDYKTDLFPELGEEGNKLINPLTKPSQENRLAAIEDRTPTPTSVTTTEKKYYTKYNPYTNLVNVVDFGLNSLANNVTRTRDRKVENKNQFLSQQPDTAYYNKRMLRGDNQMFAKKGGEYKEGGEYFISKSEIKRLENLGYEFDIIHE